MKSLETDADASLLVDAVGAGAVTTAAADLHDRTADTHGPAWTAAPAGAPVARPEVGVRPRTHEDVAAAPAVAGWDRIRKRLVVPGVMNPGAHGL